MHSSEAGCILMYALAIILKGERDVENRSFTNWKLNRLCMNNSSRGRGVQSLSPIIQLRGVQLLLVACFSCKQPLSSLEVPSSVHGSGYKLLKSSNLLEQRITAMLSCSLCCMMSCSFTCSVLYRSSYLSEKAAMPSCRRVKLILGPSVPANEAKVPAILMVVEGVLIDFQLSVLVTSMHIAQTLAVVPNYDIEIIICCSYREDCLSPPTWTSS